VIQGLATDPDVLKYASMGGTGDNMRGIGQDAMAQVMDAEVRTQARIANCNYLTEKLAQFPAITPPYVRPGYRHVYHYYNCLWDPTVFGVSRDRFLQALNAEGVFAYAYVLDANYRFAPESKPIQAGGPLHLRTIFQERNLYGKGCPFLCPHVKNPPVYREGDLPVSEEIAQREFALPQHHLSPPCDQRDMQLMVEAIEKVLEHVEELRE
jgi:dTDP-4-amino-4,6-dideoxygalactose transaminase